MKLEPKKTTDIESSWTCATCTDSIDANTVIEFSTDGTGTLLVHHQKCPDGSDNNTAKKAVLSWDRMMRG